MMGTDVDMQPTRQRILEILKRRNQATVEELSQALGLTPVTIRHHLDILRGEGLVRMPQVLRRPGPGRPQHIYELTSAASDYFPKNYHALTNHLIAELQTHLSPAEMDQVMNGVAQRLASDAPPRSPGRSPHEIMDATVSFLNEQGYVAHWEETSRGDFVLYACNCPYERVTQAHQQVCAMDASFITQVVGVPGKRLTHLGSGDQCCAYLFTFDSRR